MFMKDRDNLLAPPAIQVANIRSWNRKYSWGFSEDEIAGLDLGHDEFQMLPRAKVVTASLASVGATFDAWWQVIADAYDKTRRFSEIKSDVEHLRLIEGVDFTPNRLDVVTLNLCATQGSSASTGEGNKMAHFEALAAVAHFSAWVEGANAWSLYLGGLRVRNPEKGFPDWNLVPSVHWVPAELNAEENALVMSAGREDKPVPTAKWPVRL
jgi:hypothetical protein